MLDISTKYDIDIFDLLIDYISLIYFDVMNIWAYVEYDYYGIIAA